jgi:glycosyltransferase involved in cell wall biosynthesis
MPPIIWMSWNDSRRGQTLCAMLGARRLVMQVDAPSVVRHAVSAAWTIWQIVRWRPQAMILQHSFLLTLIVAAYSRVSRRPVRIIVDAHTKALKRELHGWLNTVFVLLRDWSFSKVCAVIVSNGNLVTLAARLASSVYVVRDPLPSSLGQSCEQTVPPYFAYIGSFAVDEPWEEFCKAATALPQHRFVCTGHPPVHVSRADLPDNVSMVGFVSETEYWSLIRGATAVIALTTEDNCLQSAAAEAIATGVPMIITLTPCQQAHYGDSAVYVQRDVADLREAVRNVEERRNQLQTKIAALAARWRQGSEAELTVLRAFIAQHV